MIKERFKKRNEILQIKIYQKISSILNKDLIDYIAKNSYFENNIIKIVKTEEFITITFNKNKRFYFIILKSRIIPFYLATKNIKLGSKTTPINLELEIELTKELDNCLIRGCYE
jgi:hypothetical protein